MTERLGAIIKSLPTRREYEPMAQAPTTVSYERLWPSGVGRAEWSMVPTPVQVAIRHAIANAKWPIYLTGSVGVGKSCASACVYRNWRGSARWHRATEIVGNVITCRTNGKGFIVRSNGAEEWCEWEKNIMDKVANSSLVVFDDIGIRDPSPAAYEVFYLMVESRKDKPTIYTSNLDAAQLAQAYDERIASRLLCGTRIRMRGDDRRIQHGVTT